MIHIEQIHIKSPPHNIVMFSRKSQAFIIRASHITWITSQIHNMEVVKTTITGNPNNYICTQNAENC